MKVIKLLKTLTLDSGIVLPSGAILAPTEAYYNVNGSTADGIPSQFGVSVYLDAASYTAKKRPVQGATEVPPLVQTFVSLADYTTKDGDTLAAQAVKSFLVPTFTASKLDIINI